MFAVPGILALLISIYVRPQEIWLPLRNIPVLYIFFALAIFGFALDLRLRRTRPMGTPLLPWVLVYMLWCMLTVIVKEPAQTLNFALTISISVILFALIGHGVQTFRAFGLIAVTVLCMSVFLGVIGTHQGTAAWGCHVLDDAHPEDGTYDGRLCDKKEDCYENDPEPGAEYMCERVGLLGTSSIGYGRVRYIGPLHDPNELALAIGVGLPFAFALFERRRSSGRLALLLISLGLIATAIIFTQSRGGQLIFLATLGTYFARKYGLVLSGILGAIFGTPLLLLGGRSGVEADASSAERLECWYEGMSMFKSNPGLGVGAGQFCEHHYLTAHNSYVLAPAETGFIGFVLWLVVVYLAVKIPVSGLRRLSSKSPEAPGPEADVARAWGGALLASFVGFLVGVFFLSFCYHQILWIYLGLSGAYYCAFKRHDPDWEVHFGWKDFIAVSGIAAFLCALLYVYTRLKM
jgi:O-antigen ligase